MSQSLDALAKANQIRIARADAWRELRALPRLAGLLACAELMERPLDEIRTATVAEMLKQPRQMGQHYARKMLKQCGMTELTTIAGATDRQREALCALIRDMRGTVAVVDLYEIA